MDYSRNNPPAEGARVITHDNEVATVLSHDPGHSGLCDTLVRVDVHLQWRYAPEGHRYAERIEGHRVAVASRSLRRFPYPMAMRMFQVYEYTCEFDEDPAGTRAFQLTALPGGWYAVFPGGETPARWLARREARMIADYAVRVENLGRYTDVYPSTRVRYMVRGEGTLIR